MDCPWTIPITFPKANQILTGPSGHLLTLSKKKPDTQNPFQHRPVSLSLSPPSLSLEPPCTTSSYNRCHLFESLLQIISTIFLLQFGSPLCNFSFWFVSHCEFNALVWRNLDDKVTELWWWMVELVPPFWGIVMVNALISSFSCLGFQWIYLVLQEIEAAIFVVSFFSLYHLSITIGLNRGSILLCYF